MRALIALAVVLLSARAPAADALQRLGALLESGAGRPAIESAVADVVEAARLGRVTRPRAALALDRARQHAGGRPAVLAIVRGLGRIDAREACRALVSIGLEDASPEARALATRELAASPASTFVVELEKGLADRMWATRALSALSLGERGAYGSVGVLVAALDQEKELGALSALAEALEKLTLEVHGGDARRWQEWWREVGPQWKPPRPASAAASDHPDGDTEPSEPSDPARTQAAPPGPAKPRAYGLVPRLGPFEIAGDIVILVVDISTSMERRGALARGDAASVVLALPTHVEALVLAFHESLAYVDEVIAPLDIPRKRALAAGIQALEGRPGTDLEAALLAAIDQARRWAEAHPKDPREIDILVLSDGESAARGTRARIPAERVTTALDKLTRQHVVRLSAYGSTGHTSDLLVTLARLSGGQIGLRTTDAAGGLLGR